MTAGRSPSIQFGAAAFGHGLALTGFMLPWIVGEFGVRQQLTGLDLTRLAGDTITDGLAGDTLALPLARLVLLLIPLAAANALVLLVANRVGALSHTVAHRAAVLLAVPIVSIALVGLALVLVSIGDGVLTGPGFGLVIVIAGGVLVVGSTRLSPSKPQRNTGT